MKNFKAILIIIIFIVVLAAIKIIFLQNKFSVTTHKQSKNQISAVNVYVVKSENMDNKIYITGTILANEEVEIKSETSGKIVNLLFKEGDHVFKGDLLLKINDSDIQAEIKKINVQLKFAGEKDGRQKKLLDINGISQEEYDASLNTLNSLKADLEYAQSQLIKTEIRAPFNGIIGLKNVSEGSYVSSSINIASIQQIDPIKIDFSVPEKYAGMIHNGSAILFSVAGNGDKFKAEVYAIEPKIDMATRTLHLRAICSNKNEKILPGSFAKIELVLTQSGNAIFIPSQALMPELKGQKVFIYKNGKAFEQKVESGIRTETQIEITNGLQSGDTLIIAGIMQLKQGANVKITDIQ